MEKRAEYKGELISELKRWQLPIASGEIKKLLDALPMGVAFSTPGAKGKIIEVNSTLIKIFGYDSKEEFLKQPASAYFFDPKERKYLSELRKKGSVKDYETRFKRKDGSLFWGSVSSISQKIGAKKFLFINLVEDITERKRREEELLISNEIITNMAEGVILVRVSDGTIVYANPKFEEIFGYSHGELVGKHISVINAPTEKSPEEIAQHIIRSLMKIGVWSGEVYNIKKDGTPFWCYANVSTFKHHEYGKVWIAVHTDITKQKRAEELARRQRDELQARSSIISSILESFDLNDRLKVILNEVMKFLKVEIGAIFLVTGNDLILRSWKGLPDRLRGYLSSLPLESQNYMPEKPQVFHERWKEKGEIFDFAKEEGIQALAILPIKIERYSSIKKKKKIYNLGTIILASRRYEALPSEEIRSIEAMSHQLALAVDHSVTFHRSRQRLVRLEVLREIDLAILSNLDVKEILKIITSSVPKELGADAVAISLLNGEKSKTRVFTIRFPNGTIIEEEAFSIADSLLHWYIDRQKPVVIYDLSQDPRVQMHHEYLHKDKLYSYLGVPLTVEGKTIGILHVLTCQPKVFMTEDIEFFQTLAGQAAIALNSAQLFEQLRQSEERFRKIAASANDAIILIDRGGKIYFWNQAAERMFGYPSQETIGKEYVRLIIPSRLRNYFRKGFDQFVKTGKVPFVGRIFELDGLKADGTEFPIEISASALKLKDQWYSLEIIRDLSEYKKYEEKLKIKDMAIESSLNAVAIATLKGEISYVNPAFLKMWGYKNQEEVLSKSVLDFWQQKEETKKVVRELKTKGKWEGELVAQRKDGSVFYVKGGAGLIKGEAIMPILMVASFVDITQLKQKKEELRQTIAKLKSTFIDTISSMTTAIEKRDAYTAGHQKRVAQLACTIAKYMGFSEERIEGLMMASLIHDIGKISVPSEILNKPSKLTEAEFTIIKTHPQTGCQILKHIDFPWPVALIVLQHHERINGSGYPQGLSGKDISLEAKIMAVADVVEAMSSHRPYRPSLGLKKALTELKKGKNVLYEAEVVDACLDIFINQGFKFE